jgi:hypothetical protein
MSFSLEYDENYNVLLVRFSGTLTRDEHQTMVAAVRRFVARHGPCHAIADFGAVENFKLDLDYIKNLAQSPAVLFGQKRVMVAPTDVIFATMRLFETHQSATGDEPMVVRSLAQAFDHLGIVRPDFRLLPPE